MIDYPKIQKQFFRSKIAAVSRSFLKHVSVSVDRKFPSYCFAPFKTCMSAQILNGTDFDAKKSAFGIILTHMPLYHVEGIKLMTN